MIRVLIADDHHIVRLGLRAILDTDSDITVVGEVDSADGAVHSAATEDIDVILMDLRFGPGPAGSEVETGAEATARIQELNAPPAVLVVTNYETDADILGAIEAGAVGYLLKDAPPEELLAAVHAAAEGNTALSPGVARRLMSRVHRPDTALSTREMEVLALVAEGKSNRTIGQELYLSEATVKSHLVHIYNKLGVRSRTSAVAVARERGIL